MGGLLRLLNLGLKNLSVVLHTLNVAFLLDIDSGIDILVGENVVGRHNELFS